MGRMMKGVVLGLASLLCCGSIGVVSGASDYDEAIILMKLFEETKGVHWKNKDNWAQAESVCEWYGVTCYDDSHSEERRGRVSKVDLSDNKLVGTLPQDIFDLEYMYSLVLRDNPDLSVSVTKIKNASRLEHLTLSNTKIVSLDKLEQAQDTLTRLHLTDCDLGGPIPNEIYKLTKLVDLYANYNDFTGHISSKIGDLHHLEELFLYENRLSGEIPEEIGQLTELRMLALANNGFSGQLPSSLEELTKLQVVAIQREDGEVRGPGISGPLPDFAKAEGLKEVYFQNQRLEGSISYDFLKSAPRDDAMVVDLRNNQLTGHIPGSLDRHNYMKLYLSGNQFTTMSTSLCNNDGWMNGNDVSEYQCNGILCPVGTFSENDGRGDCQSCTSATFMGMTSCPENDSDPKTILRKFYDAMSGDDWRDNSGWDTVEVCDYFGITCNADGEVTKVELSNNQLRGTPPSLLFTLPKLSTLDLSRNYIDFQFDGIDQALELKHLILYSTGLTSLHHVDQLYQTPIEELVLSSNVLSGNLPPSLFHNHHLKYLTVSYNAFDGPIPEDISHASSLQVFHAYSNNLEGPIPSQIGALTNTLEELVLSENKLSGPLPSELNSMAVLKEISIHQTSTNGGLSGPVPSFADCPQLQIIHLAHNALEGDLPQDFLANSDKLSHTLEVNLSSNQITGEIPSTWTRFQKLNIDLTDNQITSIPTTLCDKSEWQDGNVATYQCDAILCPAHRHNEHGRRSHNHPCVECTDNNHLPYLGSSQCGNEENAITPRAILGKFFYAANGPNWTKNNAGRNDGWTTSMNVCDDWYGITCDSEGQVTKISLENNGLSGYIISDIFELPALEEIDLRGNSITFSFDNIKRASALKILYLSETDTTDLSGIGEAKHLEVLHLTGNDISGPIPSELFDLTSLKSLYLNYNHFSGRLSSKISSLHHLEELYLLSNELDGQIPAAIGALTNLKILALTENKFGGTLPEELNELTNIEILAIQHEGGIDGDNVGGETVGTDQSGTNVGTGISGPLLSFNKLANLKELYLGGNSLSGTIPYDFLDGLADKDKDITVDLIGNKLRGRVPSSLVQFDKLNVYLAGNRFTELADGLCNKPMWMKGEVQNYQCNAILCPPNTFAQYGRQAGADQSCQPCPEGHSSTYYGSFQCLDEESQNTASELLILEQFYQEMGGNSWAFSNNWLDKDVSFCQWQGITCHSNTGAPSVQSISLPSNNLEGTVPASIFDLPNLQEINVENNVVSFENLSAIEKASNLKYLNLDATGLTSLHGIEKAPGLIFLHVKYNELTHFPTQLLEISTLQILYLSNNQIGDSLPDLSSLTDLKLFECANCGLTGAIPSWIGSMPALRSIGLKGNSLTGSIPSSILNQSTLEQMDFSDQTSRGGAGLSGDLPDFANLPNMMELYLNNNAFSGSISENFLSSVDKSKPMKIDLRNNEITGAVPANVFSGYADITLLLANNQISEFPQSTCEEYKTDSTTKFNGGDVKEYGCNAILCPIGEFNILGRATAGMTCETCAVANFAQHLGTTDCGEDEQKEILVQLYVSTSGPDWVANSGWGTNDNICSWFGVTCNDDNHITEIHLDENNLKGTVPHEIFHLPTLEVLSMKANEITIGFADIGLASKLELLGLSDNGITSIDGIGNSQSLKSIHLTGNKLQAIPEEVYSMVQLERLYFNYNEISSPISSKLGQLTNLKELFLFHNKIVGNIPAEIGNLNKLEILALGENDMTGIIPPQISNLVNLQVLALQMEAVEGSTGPTGPLQEKTNEQVGKGFSGQLPAFDTMPNLRELYLGSNSLTGMIPSSFLNGVSDKSSEMIVDLTLNNFLGSIPSTMKNFSQMRLYVAGNQIDAIPTELCGLGNWMDGEVGSHQCDAILCPPGSANIFGRQVNEDTPCETCPYSYTAEFYGSLSCSADENNYSPREILRMFYEQTGGDQWTVKDNWMEDDVPICQWHGVHCASEDASGGDDVITRIHLPSNNLSGTVPPLVFSLSKLQMLNVRDNYVSVEFHGISEAISLTDLYIDSTKTTSLAGIGKAENLQTLHIQENNFAKNPMPSELFDLTELRHLYLSDSNFGGTLPSLIGKLTNLEEFYCHGNDITGEIPSEIGNLNKLEILVLSESRFIGTLPREIENLVSLESLFIDSFTWPGVGLSGPLPSFSTFPRLREIYLGDNSFTGSIPHDFLSGLNDFQETVTVGLKSNQISGTLSHHLKRFHKLNIDISDNLITGIDADLCKKESWMEGGVGKFECDAILCPAGTFNQYGRQSTDKNNCAPCNGDDSTTYMGRIMCETEEKKLERDILTLFYQTCGGDNWKKNDNWLDPEVDICHWYGISCHQGKTVDSILLGANNIVGTPPQQIFRMAHLKWLWLYSNPIDFKFTGIEQATHLTSLLIDSTGLKSLEGIGGATRLTDLDVRFNSLTGPLTDEINNLIYLETLSLSNNNLDGNLPSFDKLTNLKSLRAGDNLFTGNMPSFETHSKLTSLDLSGNKLSGPIPSNLLNSVGTEEVMFIDLSSNFLTGMVPNELKRFDKMTLYLRDNFLEGIDPSLCQKNSWNDGDVGNFDCDGLLCSKGTYSVIGRASKNGNQCQPCSVAKFYGQSQCIDYVSLKGPSSSSLQIYPTIIAMLMAGVWMTIVTLI